MNNPNWYEGSALYKLDPYIQLFEYGVMSEVQYVIVANIPSDGEHANVVTIFAATGNGSLFGRFADHGDMHSAEIGPRLVGSKSHRRILSALQGGYCIDTSTMKARSKINRSRKRVDNAKPRS